MEETSLPFGGHVTSVISDNLVPSSPDPPSAPSNMEDTSLPSGGPVTDSVISENLVPSSPDPPSAPSNMEDTSLPPGGPVTESVISDGLVPSSPDLPSAPSEMTLPMPDHFVKFMKVERTKRGEVVNALQTLQTSKVRMINSFQCNYIIDIYSTLEEICGLKKYVGLINVDGSSVPTTCRTPEETQRVRSTESLLDLCISSLKASFLELSRIMRHGEILVTECACEDWISGALTKMTTMPKNGWSIVTPSTLHVQKLQWILDVVGKGIEEFCSLAFQNSSVKNDFRMPRISRRSPESNCIDEESDRQWLVGELTKYLNEPSSSEDESEKKQLASFVVLCRLQPKLALSLADPHESSEGSNVTLNPIYEAERFARNQMKNIRSLEKAGESTGPVCIKSWLGRNWRMIQQILPTRSNLQDYNILTLYKYSIIGLERGPTL